jgi:hypothetical protein
MKAQFDDRVITIREVPLPDGGILSPGTHGFIIEGHESPETYEVEFDLTDGPVLATVLPEDFGVA